MVNITDLPKEVIHHILNFNDIRLKDALNLSWTCRKLRSLTDSKDQFWRRNFFQRWPSLQEICDRKWSIDVNIKREIIERMKCREELSNYFYLLYLKYYYRDEIIASDLIDFDDLFRVKYDARLMNYYYLEDELIAIIDDSREFEKINLTDVYYAEKVLLYMKHCRLTDKWQTFINLPAEQQLLEQAMAITIQWCIYNARVSTSRITLTLDMYANQVLKHLKEQNPTHPIHSICVEKLPCWKHNIDKNYWEEMESRQILDAVNTVICKSSLPYECYKRIFFLTLTNNNEEFVVNHALCEAVIFHAVAGRLGVRCVLFVFPPHFFLTWRKSYSTDNPEVEDYYCIDAFSRVIHRNDCHSLLSEFLNAPNISKTYATSTQLVLYMTRQCLSYCNKHKQTFLEFRHMVDPQNTDTIMDLARLFRNYIMNFRDLIPILRNVLNINTILSFEAQYITEMLDEISRRPPLVLPNCKLKQRIKGVKYAIGMIVKIETPIITTYGVIFGWNMKFKNKNVFNYSNIPPVRYMILANEHETISSISQDFVIPLNLEEIMIINHYEIGRYFSHFKKNHYIPQQMLEMDYPFDYIIREKWVSQ